LRKRAFMDLQFSKELDHVHAKPLHCPHEDLDGRPIAMVVDHAREQALAPDAAARADHLLRQALRPLAVQVERPNARPVHIHVAIVYRE